jgi:hypothetical protein
VITPPAPPPPAPEVRTPRPGPAELGALLTAGWERALVLGSLAFLAVALLGEALGFVVWAAARTTNSPLGVVNAMRIGGFYFFGFHHIGISFSGDVNAAPFSGRIQFGFAVALLLATAIAGWLLYRFGRRVANSIG